MMKEELYKLDKEPYSLKSWYQMEVLRGAVAILIADPFWNKENTDARHPKYLEDAQDQAQTSLAFPIDSKPAPTNITLEHKDEDKPDIKPRITLDSVAEILDSDTEVQDGPIAVGEVLSKEMSELFGKKSFIKKVPELIRTIPKIKEEGEAHG